MAVSLCSTANASLQRKQSLSLMAACAPFPTLVRHGAATASARVRLQAVLLGLRRGDVGGSGGGHPGRNGHRRGAHSSSVAASMPGRPDSSFQPDADGLAQAVDMLLVPPAGSSLASLGLPAALPDAGIGEAAALEQLAPAVLGGARRLGAVDAFAHMDPPTPWVSWAATL